MSGVRLLALAAAFLVGALLIYAPALRGGLVSDDILLVENPYVQQLDWATLRDVFDPRSLAARSLHNYAPVHAVLTALEVRAFGGDTFGYHVVNVVLHALAATLLVALLRAQGGPAVGWLGALLAGAIFLVHPANVEAVAWMSQLKTVAAAVLVLGALLAHPRRPGLGALLFALALLTKAHAVFGLPVLAALEWCRRPEDAGQSSGRWVWVGVWALLLLVFAALELPAFRSVGAVERPALEADRLLHLRVMVAIGVRYLAMAAGGYGVSAFHEPSLDVSWANPWWLAGLGVLPLLAWRMGHALARRRVEGAFWVWAVAAFAPVSQVFPFLNPMADRYLYFILPGLLGGVLLAGDEVLAALEARRPRWPLRPALAIGAVGLGVLFIATSVERARIWRAEPFVVVDAALHYPDGTSAHLLRAREAGRARNVEATLAALQGARERGWLFVTGLVEHPDFASVRRDPRFQALVHDMAGDQIRGLRARGRLGQTELMAISRAHTIRGEPAQAEAALEEALEQGGALDARIRASLDALRR